jgi:hypothetical protein
MHNNFSRGAKSDVKRIKKYDFTYEVSNDPKKLHFFYNNMFLPYISKRHENEIEPFYFSYIKNLLIRTSVLLIKDKDKYIAGGLIDSKKNFATLPSMGILNGNIGYVVQGAAIALYYYHIISAKEMGLDLLDFGDSRGFVNDGGFQYKKKWGMKANLSKYHFGIFGLKIQNLSKGTLSLIEHNPFFIIDDEKYLKMMVFIDTDNQIKSQDIYNFHKRYYTPGIKELVIISPKEFLQDTEFPSDNKFKVELKKCEFMGKKINICRLTYKSI